MRKEPSIQAIARKLCQGKYTLKDLDISRAFIRKMKDAGYRILSEESKQGRQFYIQQSLQNPYFFVSGLSRNEQHVRWVELSDIHAGSIQFDEQGLRDVLRQATDEGYKDVHISGDLCDGYKVYPGHIKNLRYWKAEEQADMLTEVFLDFKLNYYAIHGNHDFSYVRDGSPNPISLIEKEMVREHRNFVYLNGMAGDLIICGALKRLVHLDGGRVYAKSYPGQTYIRNLLDSHGENVWIAGKGYRIRFLQCGHFHTDVEFESSGIYLTHPGNFQFPNEYTIRRGLVGYQGARLTNAWIKDGRVRKFCSTFIKPRRH